MRLTRSWPGRVAGWLRRLFKERPLLVAAGASLWVTLVITGVGLGVVLAVVHFNNDTDKITAVGDVLTGGILLFALVAGFVAVLSYADSSRRPRLNASCWIESVDGTGTELAWFPRDSPDSLPSVPVACPAWVTRSGDLIPLARVKLAFRAENRGQVSARNVTMAFFLTGIFFDPHPTPPDPRWSVELTGSGTRIQWDGGTDWPIYTGEKGSRRRYLELVGLWAVPGEGCGMGTLIAAADDFPARETPLNYGVEPLQEDELNKIEPGALVEFLDGTTATVREVEGRRLFSRGLTRGGVQIERDGRVGRVDSADIVAVTQPSNGDTASQTDSAEPEA